MSDIVVRLRAGTGGGKEWMSLHEEAADTIEGLRNSLNASKAQVKLLRDALHAVSLCEFNSMSSRHEMGRLSRVALANSDNDGAAFEPDSKRYKNLVEAAKCVVAWDWSDNDADACEDIYQLAVAIQSLHSTDTQ